MKIFKFLSENLLLIITLFLLAFIPLYPKLPIVTIQHTWVYIRAEDFLVACTLTLLLFLVLFKKVKLKTPLTFSMLLFWIIGAVSTFHGVLILFPTLSNVFPNVAFLSLIRRMEYMSLFFIAYLSLKNRKSIYYVIASLSTILILIVGYGLGQKFLGFPAYLTGNEEFAKGIPLQISSLARVPSTFAGNYDLAAYLVLVIPIFVSLIFGFKNRLVKIGLFITSALGFGLLFLTVSRISFFVLMLSLVILLVLQKKRLAIISLFVLTFLFLIFSPSLMNRFGKTVSAVNVLVDANTGAALGQIRSTPKEYFKDKIILRQNATLEDAKIASSTALILYDELPPYVEVLTPPNASTGENLPQGTGYVNLSLSPILKRAGRYFIETPPKEGSQNNEVHAFNGDYLIKKAKAYDLSFTTRFQGEWPRTVDAFKRNIFFGSGYGSVSLAVDNDYLRILGESGIFGFLAFSSIFLIAGIYIKKALPKVDSPVVRSFVMGFIMGTFGLVLNGTLIDVFEASKVAFTYWLLMGITLGILHLYSNGDDVDIFKEVKKALASPLAVICYLFILVMVLLFPLYANYFVGDDFTWLKWAAESKQNLVSLFTNADGFFWRPGTRLYFLLMYQFFWLNQTFYHLISIFLHFLTAVTLFMVLRKVLKDYVLSIIGVVLFIVLSGYHETTFWISSTGFIFNALFVLLSLLFFIFWKEKKKNIYMVMSITSMVFGFLFHELGVVTPLIIIAYDLVFTEKNLPGKFFKKIYLVLLFPTLPYLALRFFAQSHWFSGDYSYNLLKLPYNIVGNIIGYVVLDFFGSSSLRFYEILRNVSKVHILYSSIGLAIFVFVAILVYKSVFKRIDKNEKKIVLFGFLFFCISLLPFLGLGNITSRYSYLSSIGFVIIFAFFMKKGFGFLLSISDKYLRVMISVLIVMVYLSVQLFQFQKIHIDWFSAGEKSKAFLVSFESVYKDYWADKNMHFYLVNVPIRNGEAWIFPVGVKDALWFALPNKNFTVDIVSDLPFALDRASSDENTEVFQFDDNGSIKQVFPTKKPIQIPPAK